MIYALNKVWHREHFTCIHCNCLVGYDGKSFRKYRNNRNYPICIDCYMEEYHPKCNGCVSQTFQRIYFILWNFQLNSRKKFLSFLCKNFFNLYNSIKHFIRVVCKKALRETCVKAMNKLWHRCCFTCTKCHSPFQSIFPLHLSYHRSQLWSDKLFITAVSHTNCYTFRNFR